MKIAFFTETYLPNIDGVVISILNSKRELEKRGHEIFVLASGETKKVKGEDTKHIFHFPSVDFPPYPTYKIAVFPYPRAEEIVRKKSIDVIHSHGMGPMGAAALFVAAILNKPLVGTLHTNIQEATHYIVPIKPMQGMMKRMAWQYLRWYFNQCDAVIVPSPYMKKECIAHGIKNVNAVSNGIDLNRFVPGTKTMWRDKTVVLYVGRLVKEKNLDVAIKAAKRIEKEIPNIQFVIVGNGPADQYYKELAKNQGVSHLFLFISGVQPKDVLTYYHNADVFVFPSMFETQGLSGLEALACGLPVAGADYLAIPDIVKTGENGHLFKPHDVKGCADAVLYCIKNKKRLGRNAVKSVKSHSIDRSVARLLALYDKANVAAALRN